MTSSLSSLRGPASDGSVAWFLALVRGGHSHPLDTTHECRYLSSTEQSPCELGSQCIEVSEVVQIGSLPGRLSETETHNRERLEATRKNKVQAASKSADERMINRNSASQ